MPGKYQLIQILCLCVAIAGCRATNESDDAHQLEASQQILIDSTERFGLKFIHDPGVDSSYFMPESIGSGVALFDYDNDGLLDIYLLNGGPHGLQKKRKPAAPNRLFKQTPGGTFRDVTEASGLGDTGYGMGVAIGDIDNDGDSDVYITNYGPDVLYQNNGDGTFRDITIQAGIRNTAWGCSATFVDVDLDGWLDLYVTNYVEYNGNSFCMDNAGRQDYCGPKGFPGVTDVLFKNLGATHANGAGARFANVTRQSGISTVAYRGLGVISADLNGDGYADFYVANDGDPNNLWINRRDGTFVDEALLKGVAFNVLGQAEAGMGIALGDVENDGDPDLFVSHVRNESNTLYLFDQRIGFSDQSSASGLAGPSLALTGFGAGFFDYDHDGDLDLALVNGRVTRGVLLVNRQQPSYWDDYAEPNLLFENNGSGQFRQLGSQQAFSALPENSRGLAFGDIDRDGDVDVVVTNEGGPARMFENVAQKKGNWLSVRAFDPVHKRDALGATVTIYCSEKQFQRTLVSSYSFLSSSEARAHFGLGNAAQIDSVHVRWPGGALEYFPAVTVNQRLTLEKGAGQKR